MTLFKKLKWSNCYSYGSNNSVDLSSEKLTQIIGDNGVGKSSIPLILEEVLFNKNSKGLLKNEIANRYTDEGYSISLDFDAGNSEYTISTKRKGATLKATLTKDGVDISGHTTTDTFKTLEGILGLDFKIFPSLTYQSMYSGLTFLTDTDTTRKTFLTNLLDLSIYADINAEIKILSKNISDQKKILTGNLQAIETQIKSLERQNLDTVEIPSAMDINLENKFQEQKELENSKSEIQRNNAEIAKQESLIKTRDQLAASINYDILKQVLPADITKDSLELKELQSKEAVLKAKIQQFTKAPRGKCPTCGSPFDSSDADQHLHEASQELTPIQQRVKELNITINEANSLKQKVAQEEAKAERLKAYQDISTVSGNIIDTSNIDVQLKELTRQINDIKYQAEAAQKAINEAVSHNARVESYRSQLDEAKARIGDVQESAEAVTKSLANLEVLSKAYGSTGILTHKLHLLTEAISDAANEYLEVVSNGRFALQFKIAGEKLNVTIYDNGMECSMKALSSGEQARVNISTLLAIRRVARDLGRIDINVLFLDEIMNVLDPEGRDTLIEVLMEEQDLNCFVVSHGWTHPLVDKIEVVKEGDISKIKYGD